MRRVLLTALAGVLVALGTGVLEAAEVRFEINDAHVKDKAVAGARIFVATAPGAEAEVRAETGGDGVAVVDLEPGTYWVSYVRSGYVPIGDSRTEIRIDGQVVTTTMSMLLEAEGGGADRRIRIVLNWGSEPSDVRDADGHAFCVCGQPDAHVYYAAMVHRFAGHTLALDVDDTDWGGPETVTLSDPEPGAYRYWVHQYSHDEDTLGRSDVVVRVFFDDSMAGEFRVPPDLEQRDWKPFREIRVGPDLRPELVSFTPAEMAASAHLEPPPEPLSDASRPGGFGAALPIACLAVAFAVFTLLVVIVLVIFKRRR